MGMNISIEVEIGKAMELLSNLEKEFSNVADVASSISEGLNLEEAGKKMEKLLDYVQECDSAIRKFSNSYEGLEAKANQAALDGDEKAFDKYILQLENVENTINKVKEARARAFDSYSDLMGAKMTYEATVEVHTEDAQEQLEEVKEVAKEAGESVKNIFQGLSYNELKEQLRDVRGELVTITDAINQSRNQESVLFAQAEGAQQSGDMASYDSYMAQLDEMIAKTAQLEAEESNLNATKIALKQAMSETNTSSRDSEIEKTEALTEATQRATEAERELNGENVDNGSIEEGKNALDEYIESIKRASKEYRQGLVVQMKEANKVVNGNNKKIIDEKEEIRKLNTVLQDLQLKYREAVQKKDELAQHNLKKRIMEEQRQLLDEKKVLGELNHQQAIARQRVKDLSDEYRSLKDAESESTDIMEKMRGSLASAAASIGLGFGLKEMGSKIMETRGEFQQMEMAFTTMLGSEEKAMTLMDEMTKLAATTPFDLKGVADGAKQLLAFGTDVSEVTDITKRLGDVAAGMSIPLNDVVYLYGTTVNKIKMDTMDLRQFMNRGIPIADYLAEEFGVAKSEVADLVKAGKVGATEFKNAIMAMTEAGGKFGGLMDAQSQTITGQMSNIQDSIDMMLNEMGKQQNSLINSGLNMTSMLMEHWTLVANAVLMASAAYGTYKGALMAAWAIQKGMAIMKSVTAFLGLAKSVRSAAQAMELLNVAMSKNAIGAVAAIIAAAASSFFFFSDGVEEATEVSEKFGASAAKEINKVEELGMLIDSLSPSTATYSKAVSDLNEVLEQYGLEQIKEGDSLDVINAKRERAIELIKLEGIERLRANNIAGANETYGGKVSNAENTLRSDLKNAKGYGAFFNDNKEIQDNAAVIASIASEVAQENISLVVGKSYKESVDGAYKIRGKIIEALSRAGISKEALKDAMLTDNWWGQKEDVLIKYIGSLRDAKNEQERAIEKTNQYADATKKASEKTTTMADRMSATRKRIAENANTVSELKDNIHNLMKEYGENELNFHFNFKAEPPKWMMSMDVPQLKALATHFAELAKNSPKGANVNGRFMDAKELGQRAVDYANAAEQVEQNSKTPEQVKKELTKLIQDAEATIQTAKTQKEKSDAITKRDKYKKEYKDKIGVAYDKEQKDNKKEETAEQKREKQQAKYDALKEKQDKERQRKIVDAELERRQAEINAEKDSNDKVRKQIELDFDKTEVTIQRGYEDLKQKKIDEARALWEADPNTKDKAFDPTKVDSTISKEEEEALQAKSKEATAKRGKSLADLTKAENQTFNEYLKQYGSYEERRLAITKEYEQKISEAKTQGERYSLSAQMRKELEALNEQMGNTINWEAIFTNLDSYGVEYLEKIREDLRKELSKPDITPEKAKALTDKLEEATEQIRQRQTQWKKLVGLSIPELDKVKQLRADMDSADRKREEAQKRYNAAVKDEEHARENIAKFMNQYAGLNVSASGIDLSKMDEFIKILESKGSSIQTIGIAKDLFSNLANLQEKVQGAGLINNQAQSAFTSAKNAWTGGKGANGAAIADAVIHTVNKNLQSLGSFVDDLGLSATKGGKAIKSFAESSNYATAAFDSLKSGDFVGVAMNLNKALGSLGDTLGFLGIGGMGSSDNTLQDDIERLTNVNQALSKSIEALTEEMKEAALSEVSSIEDEQLKRLRESEQNTQNMMKRSGAEYNNGFLGVGGKSSSNKKINDAMGSAEWARISSIVGKTIKSAGDFWNLTSEQMADIAQNAPDIYAKIKQYADDGSSDAAQFMDEYVEYHKKIKEIENQAKERLTGTSFDGLADSFKDSLKEMSSDMSDFSDNVNEMLKEAFLDAMMSREGGYKDELQKWYDAYADAMRDGMLSHSESERLRSWYEELAQSAIDEKNKGFEELGIADISDTQKASQRAFGSMSEDTATELNGRFTALQISGENINQSMLLVVESLSVLSQYGQTAITQREGILFGLNKANSFLEDIVRHDKAIREDVASMLTTIKEGVRVI